MPEERPRAPAAPRSPRPGSAPGEPGGSRGAAPSGRDASVHRLHGAQPEEPQWGGEAQRQAERRRPQRGERRPGQISDGGDHRPQPGHLHPPAPHLAQGVHRQADWHEIQVRVPPRVPSGQRWTRAPRRNPPRRMRFGAGARARGVLRSPQPVPGASNPRESAALALRWFPLSAPLNEQGDQLAERALRLAGKSSQVQQAWGEGSACPRCRSVLSITQTSRLGCGAGRGREPV